MNSLSMYASTSKRVKDFHGRYQITCISFICNIEYWSDIKLLICDFTTAFIIKPESQILFMVLGHILQSLLSMTNYKIQ